MKTKTILITLIAMLTVTALIFQSCEKNEEPTNQPPTCKITSPSSGQKIPKGETMTISVDANDSDGNITEVRFFIDDIVKSTTTSFPYNYNWNSGDESLGNHALKATSIDNSGSSTSDEITIEITEGGGNNTPPTGIFTVSPNNGTTSTNFAFDASGCTDPEDQTSDLQVRWDFEGNGSWDTNWDYDKTQNHQYGSEGNYTTKLEVKDTEDLTDQYTKSITVSNGGGNGCEGQTNLTYGGQTYEIVEIGNQCWMAENLNYQTANSWWFDNNSANGDIYGLLYTWEAALTACPSGWSLPSHDEWKNLEMALGMSQSEANDKEWRGTDQGEQMKSTSGWYSNGNGTNSSGFNALAGGRRNYSSGTFGALTGSGYWWSSTEGVSTTAWMRILSYNRDQVGSYDGNDKGEGYSVRCIKD